MKPHLFLTLLLFTLIFSHSVFSQQIETNQIQGEDTLIIRLLPPFEVMTLRTFAKKKDQKKYDRLVRNVKKVYPYAKMAGERMKVYGMMLETMTEAERGKIIRSFEEEIMATHGKALRKLTMEQGRILLKLLDRETAFTPYELLENLQGEFQAFFWTVTASFFDYNLKREFDPIQYTEDLYIDEICKMIDAGQL
jgi:hypothetical protein